jgi:hypothetical protein
VPLCLGRRRNKEEDTRKQEKESKRNGRKKARGQIVKVLTKSTKLINHGCNRHFTGAREKEEN